MPEISPNGARKRSVFVWSTSEETRISLQQWSPHSTPEGSRRCELLLREIGGKIGQLQQDAVTGIHAKGQIDELLLPVAR